MDRQERPPGHNEERRKFIKAAGLASTAALIGASCGQGQETPSAAPHVQTRKKYEWKMVTTWPKNFPGLGTGANHLAQIISDMSDAELR